MSAADMTADQRERLDRLVHEYAELMFPDSHEIDAMSERERQSRTHTAYVRASWIADMVIEHRLYDESTATAQTRNADSDEF